MASRMKVTIVEGRVRVATIGIQGPAGVGVSKQYVDAGDTAARARANHTGTQLASTISDFDTSVDARVGIQKGASNGLATLGNDGKVPTGQLPANIVNTVSSVNARTGAVTGLAEDSAVLHNTGSESVAGVKTFASSPVVPTPAGGTDATNKSYVDSAVSSATIPDANATTKGKVQLTGDLGGTAASPTTPTAVHLTGDETVAGIKTFASSPVVPTPTTSTQAASKGYVDTSVSNLVASAPGALDTLDELAAALGDDANFAATVTTSLSGKQPLDATLTSLAAYNSNGILTQTGADTFAGRTITPGSSSVIVTNGNGVAGNPTIDVAAATISSAGKVLQSVYNVRDYGAVGDGSTDDTSALIAAKTAAVSAGGGRIFLPKGTYKTTGIISTTSNNIQWFGEGKGASIIKATGGYEVLSFGSNSGSTVYTSLAVRDLTIDMNNVVSAGIYGLVFAKCDTVLISNVSVINAGTTSKNQLYFGVSVGTSDEVARNLLVENCLFDQNHGTFESVLFAQARNIRIVNSTISNVSAPYGLLQYGSTHVSIENCRFESGADVSLSRRGARVVGNDFFKSYLELSGVEGASIIGNKFDGDSAYGISGIKMLAEVNSTGIESGWDNGTPPFTRLCSNIVMDGNEFYRCNPNSINSGNTLDHTGAVTLASDSLTITNNTIRQSYWQGIDVKANRLVMMNNILYNNGQLNTSTVRYNFTIAAKNALIAGNHSYDDQTSHTAVHDYFIDNQLSASAIPTMNLTMYGNNFEIGDEKYWNGSSFSSTQPGNVTITTYSTGTSFVAKTGDSMTGALAISTTATNPLDVEQSGSTVGTKIVQRWKFAGAERFLMRQNDGTDGTNGGTGFTDFRIEAIQTSGGVAAGSGSAILSLIGPNPSNYADYTYSGSAAEIDVSHGPLALRPLDDHVLIWAFDHSAKLRIGDAGFNRAFELWHDATDGQMSTTSGRIVLNPASTIVLSKNTRANASVGINTDPSYDFHQLGGGFRVQALATPSAPVITNTPGTPGTTTYTYYVVAVDRFGNKSLPSPPGTTTTGNAVLSNTNQNLVTWTAVPGAVSYDVLFQDTAHRLRNVTTTFTGDNVGSGSAYTAPTRNATADATIDGKLTLGVDPTSSLDAATKQYVDSIAQGIKSKASVRAATTANATLASAFANGQVIDGVTLATGDRILLKNQTTGSENGIYTVAASGAPTRATDADASSEIRGMFVFVEEGTANADTGWLCTNDGTVTLGSTALTFVQFSSAGVVLAGSGLSKSGNTISIDSSVTPQKSDNLSVFAATTSAQLAGVVSDETGTGALVFATSPTLVTPALGTPSSGVATNLTGTASGLTAGNVTTNANLTGPITSVGNTTSIASQTGTGSKFVVDNSPTLVTPTIGAATATSINKMAITAPTTGSTLAVADGKTFTASNSLTLAGTDSTTMTFPSTSATIARTDAANTFTGHQTIEGVTSTGATGTGQLVFSAAPTFTGTLAAAGITASKAISSGVSALTDGTNIATDASQGNEFSVTLGGNRTMDNPTNLVDGQKIIYRIKQDGTGTRTITWGSVFRFPSTTPPTLTTTASKTDYVGFIYNGTDSKLDQIAFVGNL